MTDHLISRSRFLDALVLDADNKTDLIQVHHALEKAVISPDEVRGVGTWLRKEKVRHNLDGDGDYRYECSACGHSDEHNENVHVPFCWYCGAKMEVD
jgi:hypothetical protein